jgi:hypothetical protein
MLLAACFHAGFLLGLFIEPEDGSDMFLRIMGQLSTDFKEHIQKDRISMYSVFIKGFMRSLPLNI